MADAIASRIDPAGNGSSVSQYQLRKAALSAPTLTKVEGPDPGAGGNQMDVIIKVDWSSLSSLASPGTADETGRELAGTLLNPPTDGTYARSFVELPLHFIGHSRGTYVNSAIIKELGRKGIWVDHCTILDGEDYGSDGDLAVWSNIKFADNYYQELATDGLLETDGWLDGFPVPGAVSFDLSPLAAFGGAPQASLITAAHQRVHTYYHGTIDLNVSADIDGQEIRRSGWYPFYAGPGAQPIRGFYYSRFVPNEYAKADYLAGLAQHFGGYAANQMIVSSDGSAQWPNVVLQNRDNLWTVQSGTQIRIHYPYWDTDSSCTITFATDDDQNPYNNADGNEVGSVLVSQTQGGFWPDTGVFNWVPSLSHNNRHLFAKISESGGPSRTRYFYLSQKFSVAATPPPPPPPPPNQGNDLSRSASLVWDDHDGDKDGVPEAGETVGLKIRLRNMSASILRDVRGTLSSGFGNAQITDALNLYNDLNPDQATYGSGDYEMYFNFGSTAAVPFHLRATYTKDNVDYYQDWDFTTTINQNGALEPSFAVDHVVWDDAPPKGDGDGIIESGEKPDFWIWLKNTGSATATEVRATVTDVAVLRVRDETLGYPNLAAGGAAQGPTSDFDLYQSLPKNFAGLVTADILVTYSGNNLQKTIFDYPLFDIKPAPWIQVSPERYDFGVSPTTTNVLFTWTIRNTGTTSMDVTAITSTNADTRWSGDALPWNIAAGVSKTITVSITTSNLQGPITRTLSVTTDARIDDVGEDDRIIITGVVGDAVPLGQLPNVTGGDHPDISGDWIVWMDGSSGNADIYAYNLSTSEKRQITTNTNQQYSPYISGNLIVWNDKRDDPTNSYYDVYAYDFSRPDLREFRVAPALTSGRSQVLGVDGNRVALSHIYEWLYDSSSPDAANNLYVYEYVGNGQFTSRFTTGFTPGSGTQTRQSVDGPDGDFGEGVLTFEQGEVFSSASTGSWQTRNWTTRVINFAVSDSNRQVINGSRSRPSAAANRFVYERSDENGDAQIWMWREPDTIQQLTFTPDLDYADDVLGIGGPAGGDCLVYDYGEASRPGLYYLDRNNGQEYLISSTVDPHDLRMDGLRVVFRDRAASDAVKYLFLKQPDIAIAPANIIFDNDSPAEGSTINVGVTVQNLSGIGTTASLTVQLYDGNPDAGGIQIAPDRVISGGLGARSSAVVTFTGVPVGGVGSHTIFTRVTVVSGENPANNKVSRALSVAGAPQTVSLDVTDGIAFETGPKVALVTFQRSGSTNAALGVNYSVSGAASGGVDFAALAGSIIIPAGSAAATLFVTPIEDALAESDESVVITLVANAAYSIGSPGDATVMIADNDRTPQKPWFGNLSLSIDGGFRFNIGADRGRIYVLDTSTNLVQWTPLITNVTPSDIFELIDPTATNGGNYFYRARHP